MEKNIYSLVGMKKASLHTMVASEKFNHKKCDKFRVSHRFDYIFNAANIPIV